MGYRRLPWQGKHLCLTQATHPQNPASRNESKLNPMNTPLVRYKTVRHAVSIGYRLGCKALSVRLFLVNGTTPNVACVYVEAMYLAASGTNIPLLAGCNRYGRSAPDGMRPVSTTGWMWHQPQQPLPTFTLLQYGVPDSNQSAEAETTS